MTPSPFQCWHPIWMPPYCDLRAASVKTNRFSSSTISDAVHMYVASACLAGHLPSHLCQTTSHVSASTAIDAWGRREQLYLSFFALLIWEKLFFNEESLIVLNVLACQNYSPTLESCDEDTLRGFHASSKVSFAHSHSTFRARAL